MEIMYWQEVQAFFSLGVSQNDLEENDYTEHLQLRLFAGNKSWKIYEYKSIWKHKWLTTGKQAKQQHSD